MAFPIFIDIVECFANKHKNESAELDFSVTFLSRKSDKN